MGLDIALGVMIFFGAIRGWFRGFAYQALHLGSMVGAVYMAGPLRDYIGPQVLPYLKSIDPSLLGRLLWWASVAVSYVAIAGTSMLALKAYRRKAYGEPEPNRTDQFAGLLLAATKNAIIAAFLVGAIDRHVVGYVRQVPWAAEQVQTSRALGWHNQYKPADQIWATPPVQMFVSHVRQMGVDPPKPGTDPTAAKSESPTVQTAASRPPRLDLPRDPNLDVGAPDLVEKIDEALQQVEQP